MAKLAVLPILLIVAIASGSYLQNGNLDRYEHYLLNPEYRQEAVNNFFAKYWRSYSSTFLSILSVSSFLTPNKIVTKPNCWLRWRTIMCCTQREARRQRRNLCNSFSICIVCPRFKVVSKTLGTKSSAPTNYDLSSSTRLWKQATLTSANPSSL